MNIFFISTDAAEAARMHGDKHVIKMILESAQMLITCHRVLEEDDSWILKFKNDLGKEPYKMTHANHPCTIWARSSMANYAWLCDLALALCDEKMERWPDKKPHACRPMLEWLAANPPPTLTTRSEMTEPATAMPDEFKVPGDPVASYRRYYRHKFDAGIATYGRMPDRLPRFIHNF